MVFKLPEGVTGEKVMLQWKYITANSCSPEVRNLPKLGATAEVCSFHFLTKAELYKIPFQL